MLSYSTIIITVIYILLCRVQVQIRVLRISLSKFVRLVDYSQRKQATHWEMIDARERREWDGEGGGRRRAAARAGWVQVSAAGAHAPDSSSTPTRRQSSQAAPAWRRTRPVEHCDRQPQTRPPSRPTLARLETVTEGKARSRESSRSRAPRATRATRRAPRTHAASRRSTALLSGGAAAAFREKGGR